MVRRALGLAVVAALPVALVAGAHVTKIRAADPPPDVILIITDDQRWDTLDVMPKLQRDLVERGVTFTHAYTATPSCCPSRAGILTGLYPPGTGVWHNDSPYGGFPAFDDGSTIATWLHASGYTTGLFGKYLNHYEDVAPRYIPPGWDRWYVHLDTAHYGYPVNDQGVIDQRGFRASDYSTNDITDEAVSFIERAEGPLFAYVALNAPHHPYTPPPDHERAFGGLAPWRPPSYNERDVADKPRWVRATPRLGGVERRGVDADRLNQLRMLLGVDDSVRTIVRTLKETGRLDDALIIFVSDNGFSWGEHRLTGKGDPYEESIRVPMVVRFDRGVAGPGSTDDRPVLNIDIAPTIAQVTGLTGIDADGRSIVPLLDGTASAWRSRFLTMMYTGVRNPRMTSFCQIHTPTRSFTVYRSGEEEDYVLRRDPWELDNLAGTRRGVERRDQLREELYAACAPPPPDMRWPAA